FVVGVHHRGRSGSENDGWRLAVEIEEARVGRALPSTDDRLFAGDLGIATRDGLDDRMAAGNFRRLRVIADEAHDGGMILHPWVGRGRPGDLVDQASLDALMILYRHGADAALEQAVRGEGAWVAAGLETADDAGQRIDRAWINGVSDGRDPDRLKLGDGFGDRIAEIDAADAKIALLDAGRFPMDLDLEPDPADAGRLHREIAGLAGDSCVGVIAADDRVERAVAAHLL